MLTSCTNSFLLFSFLFLFDWSLRSRAVESTTLTAPLNICTAICQRSVFSLRLPSRAVRFWEETHFSILCLQMHFHFLSCRKRTLSITAQRFQTTWDSSRFFYRTFWCKMLHNSVCFVMFFSVRKMKKNKAFSRFVFSNGARVGKTDDKI